MPTALLIVDLQNDYFPGGALPLVGAEHAAERAAELLERCREAGRPPIHVRHLATRPGATFFLPDTPGAEIHAAVRPRTGEPVVEKHLPNAFRDTVLQTLLADLGVDELVICGAMSHMCIDATTRAAFDLGYRCSVAADACATRDLEFDGRRVAAADVHAAFMAALAQPYARVATAGDLGGAFA
ncbi:MAG: cysteine hydrolase family protein [Gammaproteobacteria bacterium]|nr:cysteine hydrolase family protein [Gammaproteobacteria bacterium]